MNDRGADVPPIEFQVDGLAKAFGDLRVLDGVDLTVRRGELVAIVGASGSGKSVLLHTIVGLLPPDAGCVRVADHERDGDPLLDLATLDEEQLNEIRRHWAIVFQRNALLSGSVYENFAMWLREILGLGEEEIRERASRALSVVGLDPETVLPKDRDELSGGMAKRVAVAQAISREPMLVFYDEPTTGLDPAHARMVHELIRTTHENSAAGPRTTVIVTHDKDLLYRLRPRVAMLHKGRVFFDDTYERFMGSASPEIRPYFDLMPVLQQRKIEGA